MNHDLHEAKNRVEGTYERIVVVIFTIALLTALAFCCTAGAETTLTLPNDLTVLEEEAFFGDTSLETVVLPEGLQTIGTRAFAESSVKSVNLPDSLTEIADDAFEDTNITSMTFNEGTYAYDWAMRHGYTGWSYNELPDGTVEIASYTLEESTVTIPQELNGKQVSVIADGAFAGSSGLVNLTVPGTITRIGEGVFAGIGTLMTVTVQQGVTEIGSEAFADCPKLISVTLPDNGVTALGEKVFRYCEALETVNLPSGITEVPKQCFWDS